MKNMLLATLVFGLVFVPAVCSEVSAEVSDKLVLQVKLQGKFKDGSRRLTLLGVDEIANLSRIFPRVIRVHNHPFFAVTAQKEETISRVKCTMHENCFVEGKQLEDLSSSYQRMIRYFPGRYFEEKSWEFAPNGTEIYSVGQSCNGHTFALSLQFDSDLEEDETLMMYLNKFVKNPRCFEKDLDELLDFNLLAQKDVKITHGLMSSIAISFTPEEAEILQATENERNALKEKLSSYRKGFIGISTVFAILMLYILHDKFHDKLHVAA